MIEAADTFAYAEIVPVDEARYFREEINPYRLEVVKDLELDSFRRAAQRVMERRGISTMAQVAWTYII